VIARWSLADGAGLPLGKVCVFRPGVNQSDLGPAIWNDKARKDTMSVYASRGNLILLDVNHNMSAEAKALRAKAGVSEEPATAGYASLEIGADGSLWMVPQYSAYAEQKIRSKEMRYISPEFLYNPKTREVRDIIRISLVHEPATWGARLVASAPRRKWSMITAELMAAIMELATKAAELNLPPDVMELVGKVVTLAGTGEAPASAPAPEMETLAADPEKEKDLPPMAMKRQLSAADRFAAERATIEGRMLCSSLRSSLVKDLEDRGLVGLTPAEQKMLSVDDPEKLRPMIALLSASARAPKASPNREPEKKGVEGDKKANGAYATAALNMLAARGLKVEGVL